MPSPDEPRRRELRATAPQARRAGPGRACLTLACLAIATPADPALAVGIRIAPAQDACGHRLLGTARLEGLLPAVGTFRPALAVADPDRSAIPAALTLSGVLSPAAGGAAAQGELQRTLDRLAGMAVTVYAADDSRDRRGRLAAHLLLEDGSGLQERLLAAGLVLADATDKPCAPGFFAAETFARAKNHGIWSEPALITHEYDGRQQAMPDFALIAGQVHSTGRSGSTLFVNFGGDIRFDSTIRLGAAVEAALTARGLDPARLAGSWIEARGWAVWRDGVDMRLDDADALVLAGGPGRGTD